MEKQKIKVLLMIALFLFIGCSLFGFIDKELMPLFIMKEFFLGFINNQRLFSTEIITLMGPALAILSIYNFKKIITYYIASFIFNLLLIKVLGNNLSYEVILYAANFSLISVLSVLIREPVSVKNQDKKYYFNYYLFAFLISIIFSFIVQSGINFGSTVVPISRDIQAIFIDSFTHIPRSSTNYLYFFNDIFNKDTIFYTVINVIYKSLSICIVMLACLEFRMKGKRYYVNTLLFAYVGSILGVSLYFLYPIMGPIFFEAVMIESFKDSPNWINYLGNDIGGSIFPRNGMPSLHLAFALFMYLNTRGLHVGIRCFSAIFLVGTAVATLLLGEHYIIDWMISPAFVLLVMTLCALEIKVKDKIRIIIENLLLIACWYLFLWFGVHFFANLFNCIQCSKFNYAMTLSIYSFVAIVIFMFFRSYKQYKSLTDNIIITENVEVLKDVKEIFQIKGENSLISLLFILSGFAGLMYQVIFGKMLGTIFGSTSLAIYIVLATYMIGLSLGAYLGGKESSKISALLKYAICEILIAVFCIITPIIFFLIEKIYFMLGDASSDIVYLSILKIVLGISGLIIPTTLMGMTTPILLKHFNKTTQNSVSLAHLYTLNTLGAALGAVLSGYFIIQGLGVKNSIYLTVIINLLIGAQAIKSFKKDELILPANFIKEFFHGIYNAFKFNKQKHLLTNHTKLILFLLFISGLVTMSLETLFIHGLSIVVGNSAYAFSIMLFTFLIGLSLGGYIGKSLIINKITGAKIISFLQVVLGLSIFISFNLLDLVPDYLASFQMSSIVQDFIQREFIRGCACIIIMILPTIAIGALYSLLMDGLLKDYNKEDGESITGYGLAINTIGNIVGVFLGGLLFLNLFGLMLGLKFIALLVIACSVLVLGKDYKSYIFPMSMLGLLLIVPFSLNMDKITSGSNVYFANANRGHVINYEESMDGGLTSVNSQKVDNKEVLTLLTNGKFQGNNSGEIFAQGAFAIAPLMHTEKRDNALVIGYGTGMTARAVHDSNFSNVDIVELSSDILDLADKYFSDINKGVRNQKNVKTIVNDGRNYLRMTPKKYDFISMELSSIWFAGASYLYNKEFYQIAKEKLTKDGVLQQWVQLHHMRPEDFMVILNTLHSEFKYVNLYFIGGQGIIVATNSEKSANPDVKNINFMNNIKELEEIKKFYKNDFSSLLSNRILSPSETDKLLLNIYKGAASKYYSTDDNLYLEYNTPKGNTIKEDTTESIRALIEKYKK